MKLFWSILLALILVIGSFKKAEAACVINKDSQTVNTTCTVAADTVEGIDTAETQEDSTVNSAVLTVGSSGAITINSGSGGTTKFIFGSMSVTTGGSVSIGSTSVNILVGNGIWVTDGDGDGWANGFDVASDFFSATASGIRRFGHMLSDDTADCDDAAYSATNTCYGAFYPSFYPGFSPYGGFNPYNSFYPSFYPGFYPGFTPYSGFSPSEAY
jgi:hypothetical protein